ncbi:vacuolar protein sorting-associated protein 4A-like [Bactrocera neohumeralis]|uniref:vacuolar protein sorting-associated protein 4A-like n=1 Tax=Bactrocera neohumeralis TaxID=98809 RepID=UPI00216515F5|nr:vacuolar protein sorting-associated protein 4A-like [Bactrocera neohumeralis]
MPQTFTSTRFSHRPSPQITSLKPSGHPPLAAEKATPTKDDGAVSARSEPAASEEKGEEAFLEPARPLDTLLRWSDIQGCDDAIVALKQAVLLPRLYPWLFAVGSSSSSSGTSSNRTPWQRILLYGPPGTGKTLLAHATAGELSGCPFISVSSADVLSKWVGESEKHVKAAFAQAARYERCLLFLDEVDAMCASRGSQGETEVARRLKTEFLFHLQALPRTVTVIAATNLPWELDAAIMRRFDAFVYVGLPQRRPDGRSSHAS